MENFSPEQITYLATSIANDIAKKKNNDEINVIRCVLSQICSTLSTYLSQENLCKNNKSNKHK